MGIKGTTGLALIAALLAGCGGGSGTSTTPPVSHGSGTQTIAMKITVPAKSGVTLRNGRRRFYNSSSTLGMSVDFSVHPAGFANSTPNASPAFGAKLDSGESYCTAGSGGSFTCTVYIPGVPVGYDDFKISEWNAAPTGCLTLGGSASPSGNSCTMQGSALSTNVVPNRLVVQNQNNVFNFTLLPVVDSVTLAVNPSTLVDGTAASATLNVFPKDASGNEILGGDTFVDADGTALTINIASSDPLHVVLGTTSFTSSAAGPAPLQSTIAYDGTDVTGGSNAPGANVVNMATTLACTPACVTNGSIQNYALAFTKTNNGFTVPPVPQVGLKSGALAGAPSAIVPGPPGDAHVYTIENGKVAQISTATGLETAEFAVSGVPTALALGADNDIWYVDHTANANKIGKFNPLTANVTSGPFIETPAVPGGADVRGIATAADGNEYFTTFATVSGSSVFKVTPLGMTITSMALNYSNVTSIAAGTLANGDPIICWVTGTSVVCYDIKTASVPGGLSTGATLGDLVFGPDGLLYAGASGPGAVLAINPDNAGTTTLSYTYALANASAAAQGLTVGADGAVWFAETGNVNMLGRIQPGSGAQGVLSEYSSQIFGSSPPGTTPAFVGIATGADNNLWLTDGSANNAVDQVLP